MTDPRRRILLTRPAGENESLANLLVTSASEFDVLVRPLIAIGAIEVSDHLRKTAMNLDLVDDIIFVSKAAVRFGMEVLEGYWPQWPTALKWYAVGEGTASLLGDHGVRASYPKTPGSEGLLALPDLASMDSRRVMIVRGMGGRELIADSLRSRGAEVGYWEIYRRDPVHYEDWSWISDHPVVVLTSGEAIEVFAGQIGQRDGVSLIVVSERTEAIARALGFSEVINAGGASDQALYDAICGVREE